MKRQQQIQQQQQQQQQITQQTQQQSQQFTTQQQQRTVTTRQVTQQQHVQGMVVQQTPTTQLGLGSGVSPPVFEQIFKNARFAQGGNALFEGRVVGSPKPVVSWTRKGSPLLESNKYRMKYEQQTGNVSLLINNIGPGDEGEYTCLARNQYGEAICSVYIQPEGVMMPQPQIGGTQTFQRTEKTTFSNGFTTVEEDFKVDTFEYRLLREVSFRETLTRRYINEVDSQISTTIDRALGPPAAPQVGQKPRNSKIQEGSDATFSVRITANPKPRLTWFKNGQRIVQSQKHQSSYSNQTATLKISKVSGQDSGHYTLLAENPQGCIVSSAYLAVEQSGVQDGIYQSDLQRTQVDTTEVDSSKMLAPNFVRVCADRDAQEGKMTRFDCRVTGRPYPEVAWFISGKQVVDDATHKILVNESGNHSLMITSVSRLDSGVVACVARNKAGETSFQCNLNVIEKELVVAPKFVERFTTVNVKEGEPVVLSARAVGTPVPKITWQKDGVQIQPGLDVTIITEGGASTLDLPRAKSSDAGWYQCTAQNVAGSTATRARLYVQTTRQDQQQEYQRRLNLPKPTKVIEPEIQPGPEVIYLRHVERAKPHTPHPEEEKIYPPPQFIIPLRDVSQIEGGRIHFEARIEPVGDPSMRVDWFHNGRPLPASSRLTTTFRFGFIALDLLSIVMEDSGEYVCRVSSNSGAVESKALLSVQVRASIEQTSQHPESLQYLSQLEDYSKYQRTESIDETTAQRPAFIRPLHDLGQLQEGRNAHFEAQLTPVSDPTMKVEWYKDGRPITASSRITTIFNFGYVSLNIMHLRAEDSGSYTVRAVNRWGEAVSTSTLSVLARSSVTGELGIPEQQRYIEKVEELEAYQTAQQYKTVAEPPESTAPPVFKSPIKEQLNIKEGGFAHFEARLEPIGDSTLKVEWLKDGKPVEASSRITTFFNFGYVALTIKYVTVHDVGVYSCRAYNKLGQAETKAQMTVLSRKDIISDSQHPSGLQKIQTLEDSSRYARMTQEEMIINTKPRFLGPLKGTNKIVEGQRAHFEVRVEPLNDSNMKIDWYFNGKLLQTANRIQTYHDFGYVALDILSVRSEDAGQYTVVARNNLGEAQISTTMEVETRASIDTTSMHRGTYEKTQRIESSKFTEPQYYIEELCKSKPIFVQPLSEPKPLSEGKNVHLEARLEPMGDPTMRVEWFHNGRPVTVGSRFRTYNDFGFVALDIIHVTVADTGEYTVRATNQLGTAHTSAMVRVIGRSGIETDTQNESSLEQIQFLEDSSRNRKQQVEDVTVIQAPQFTRPLHNLETIEGTNIHLECRLQPVGDSSMRIDWFVNGKPVRTGHRFRPAYDFDYVALDLLSVYPEDSGVYTCQARNQLGEAVTSCSVKVIAKRDLLLDTQHPGGLEKIQYLEDASRYKKQEFIEEVVTVKPKFITTPKSLANMKEGQHAHFECKLEPVADTNLKVEWFKDGRPVTVGHRFRPIHDFGYVALDIVDLIAEDSGTYTCRAVNVVGSDETACNLQCRASAQIITGTQNETGLEQIQYLEDKSRYQRSEVIEETTTQVPVFTTSLKQCDIKEGQRAHFECRLIPVSDVTMKVEWFHNNVPIKSGSRFTETNSFGFVALDILHCLPEDSGTYTCRAKNIVGEAVTSSTLNVQSKKSIYLETQHEAALSRLSQLEDSSRYQRSTVTEETVSQAPVFTQPMKDIRLAENQAAHFEARLIPVGDTRLKVEWLRNGVPIAASNRVTTMHDFGYVALNFKYVYPEDSGTYTCRAVNDLGEAVTSATMVVQSKESLLLESQHQGALQKLQALEDTSKYKRKEEQEIIVTQAPKFTAQLNGPTELVEGQSAHYECRIEPYPDSNLKVEWFHNGKPLQSGHRFRTTYDFGFASLDVLTVYGEDSGEYTCKATNKLGHASSSIKLNVKSKSSIILDTQHEGALQKIRHLEDDSKYKKVSAEDKIITERPQFGRPLKNIEHLPEGHSAHLEATLTPVNDPTMKVEWFCNGRPIQQGHRFKTTYDFGFVALDILYAYPEDSGTYMCKARNAIGEAVTTCAVSIDSKSGLQLDTLDEQRMKKIRELEHYERPTKEEVEPDHQKPVFITPLNNLEGLKEGDHAHLECRVEPINDPNLRIEWFMNGVAIRAGHRFRTTHDFGYVALDILYTWGEDTGTYMCKATNLKGEAVNTCNISVQSKRSVYLETQHPAGLEKIQELEAQGHPAKLEIQEPIPTPPRFVTELRGTTDLFEGQTAHFECQVEPLHDPNLRIEFYHNGKPLPSASRFHITFDFGYVALDITHIVPEDAGEYSVKAINKLGQCTSSIKLNVTARGNVILESQRPEGLEKIKKLEEGTPFQRPEVPEPVTRQRPVFTQPLQNIDFIAEGQTAHFECRLIPVGDPTLKVEWFRNEKPLETSSRIAKTHDFGFVSMDMTHIRAEDEGVYMCRASNALGEAVTTASMRVKTKADIQLDTQHPEGMKKIQELEGRGPAPRPEIPDKQFDKPVFTQLLTGPSELWEGQHAHFECRVVPVGDPTLKFEWFVNGVELKMGSRFRTTHDFGFVTLDIQATVPEDSGVYMCKAINRAGEAVSSTSLKVKSKSAIAGDSLQPDAWQKIQLKEAEMNKVPPAFVDTAPQQAPVFTRHLENKDKLVEGQHVHLEAQVEPRTDPNLRVEWFKNGISLTTGSRIRSTFDFGLVSLTINGLRPDDSAIYTCKATNLLGEAVSTCTIKVEDRNWLQSQALRPDALPLIEDLERPKEGRPEAIEPVFEGPVFISHLNNNECNEGENVHFECQVEPSKDPTMKIEWFVNGKPLPTGSRFKSTYDFGLVTLDINHVYAEDSGIYMVKATNSKGQASTSGSLRCHSKKDIYLDTQHPMGQAGLEKVQEVEDAFASKYQRQPSVPDAAFPKPVFTIPLQPEFHLSEAEPLHLEAQVEPKADPKLKVEWYFNGKVLEHGSRFKVTSDFGFVTLDLTEVYDRDQGIYTCKAYNDAGEAFTSTTIYCTSKAGLIEQTQHPKGEEGLEKIQTLEEALRRQEPGAPEAEDGQAPVFTKQFQNLSNLSEGEIAHFEASLTPVGDQTMVVEWFYNGKPLEAGHRFRTVYAFGMVVLEVLGTKIEDTGTYSCRATNKWGRAEISVTLECVDKSKGQKPQFTSHIKSLEGLKDGDSAHFECTLIPVDDPNLKVEWFHNGQPIRQSSRIKSVSDFGFVVMDIAYTQSHDTGEYICKASNKYGEDFTKATIKCIGKGGVYLDSLQPDALARIRELELNRGPKGSAPPTPVSEPPRFITQIKDVTQLKEGQSAHFEARLTPVDDPNLVVEWFYNGKKLPHGHRYRTFHDFGIVILDILYCYEENSGEYECRATNKVGTDSTKATLKCLSKASLILTSQLPQGMEGGLEKIQNLEDAMFKTRDERVTEERGQAPVFTVPLANIESLREGENAHFEARLTPTDDPKLKVEWFWNGKPLRTGSRFRTFCDFGFVILEISPVYPEDSGEYSCRAFNDYGQAVTTATMKVQGKRSIILDSQLPKGMEGTIEKIAELEGLGQAPTPLSPEADSGKPPEFITTPADLVLGENQLAHFECRLTPVNDASMRVEWFHNGKPLFAGSRVKTINDFGFVILEVAGCYQRDSGLYTCKATNKHGEATVSCQLQVRGRQGIILEPQLPSTFSSGTESIQKLEESLYKKEEILSEEEKPNPPRFVVELKDILEAQEAQSVHFDCKVEPVGDSSMRIDWFFNGRPFATGSRVHMLNDFGFIVLDMDYVYARDSGEYICRATNKWGTATTKAKLICKAKQNIILDSQLPQGMSGEKLKELEKGPVSEARPEDALPTEPPKFITQIESATIGEAEPVHFECRVEPKKDPTLRIEWYRNGKPLPSGHRYRTLFDLGFVSLDILYVYPEDSGEYVCRAVNNYGEDFTKATVSCKQLPTIILQNQVPKGMKKSEALMQMEAAIKKYTSEIYLTEEDLYEAEKKQPPRFVTQILDQTSLVEMQATKFECQLAPVGDPNMKVEWFFNGKPLTHKNRFTPIYDFGYVAMNFGWVYPEDSGEYLCRATNLYGMDETRAIIKTTGKPGIIYDSQLPKGMKSIERIREMEAAWQHVPEQRDEPEKPKEAPVFVTKPEPFTVEEGDWARFCCRVTGFPRPRVMWLINGHTVVNGMRYKLTYDGMWHLDIPKTRQYDHGKVEVVARNFVGEARYETTLTVKPRTDDYRGVLKNSPRPWYDYGLSGYQSERQDNELEKVFEERQTLSQQTGYEIPAEHAKTKVIKEPEPEWTQSVRAKKNEDYYSKLRELEEEQIVKENRIREASHQFAIPGEKIVQKSVARGMAESYETNLAQKSEPELMPWQKRHKEKLLQQQAIYERDSKTGGVPPDPVESSVRGREVHVAKQKQVQKEVRGDTEITRNITATETTEMEHQGRTQERVVQGKVQPAKPPFFTKKIQPCRAFEQEQARFEVEFDGEPIPKISWYREDFLIQNSPDFQIHTFSTKSILIIRQVFMEDSGVFACVAENRGGKAKCSANLVVEERRQPGRGGVVPPSFLQTVQSAVVNAGQLARFDARITATKPIDVYWLKNGKKIQPDVRYKSVEEDNMYTLLIIETVLEDSAKYECVAINSAGEARCEAELIVQAAKGAAKPGQAAPGPKQTPADQAKDQAPAVIEPLRDQLIKEGQPVIFRCKITGKPALQIKWQKGDQVIKPSKYFQMLKEGDVYTLKVSEAFPEDEGVYKCVASNPGGQVVLSANLNVQAPDVQEVAPSLSPMKDVVVPEGSPAQFRTSVGGKPTPAIQWFREGLLIPQSPDFQMIHEGNNAVLLIASTYEEDSGVFTCIATNSTGQAETSANLIVQKKEDSGEAPRFTQPLKPQIAMVHENVVLTCTVIGRPTPEVKWYRVNEEIIPDDSHQLFFNPDTGVSTLAITNATPEIDEKFYSVRAVNKFGKAECRANIVLQETAVIEQPEVLEAPKITKPLQAVMVEKGQPVTLEVEFTGIPQPEVRWYRNGREILPSSDMEVFKNRTTLTLHKTTTKVSGKYEVRAMNSVGEARTSGSVTIREREEIEEMKDVKAPRFIQPLQPKTVCEGEVAIMEVIVESYPTCSFQWFQHSVAVKSSPEVRIMTENNRSALMLPTTLIDNAGDYTVRAENVIGSVTSTATLNVLPEWEQAPDLQSPVFVQTPVTAKVMDGESALLTCKVIGKPTPKVTWFHNGKPVNEGKQLNIYQDEEGICKLAITEVFPEDTGLYTCIAQNTVGESVCSASLVVEAYEYVPDSEVATSLITAQSGSEEDLLADKEEDILEDTEIGSSPKFITPLPEEVPANEGELVRLKVKVVGSPKPKVRWYKQETEIVPSQDFQIENFEDGTSVLTITEIFPDDVGEIVCEAQNELGVDSTVTLLNIGGIIGTKEYRKPEWVTHMEELQAQLKALQAPPSFVQDITDIRLRETESAVFELQFSGTPLPDIIWYHNDKILRSSKNVKIIIKNKKTSVTIHKATLEDAGTYVCKATSEIGQVVSKAKLYVQEIPKELKEDIALQQAKEEEELIKIEKVKREKKRDERRKHRKRSITFEEEKKKEPIDVQEVVPVESTETFTETVEKVTAHRKLDVQETAVEITAIPSLKKVDKPSPEETPEDKAEIIAPIQESMAISEVVPEEKIKEIPKEKVVPQEKADITETVQESVAISEIHSESAVEEFKAKVTKKQKATRKVTVKESVQVEQTQAEESKIEEFVEEMPEEKAADVIKPVQESVSVTEIQPQLSVEEITEKKVKKKQAKERKTSKKETAVVTQTVAEVKEVEEVLQQLHAEEFGPGQQPLAELATIGVMIRHGVSVQEVISQYEAEQFPSLRTAPAQSAIVNLVEREGHSALISEVLTQETTTEQMLSGVFSAFLRMIELKHATVEEVLPLFAPEDFQPQTWEQATSQVTTEETKLHEVTQISDVKVEEMKVQTATKKKVKKTEVKKEEEASLSITKEEEIISEREELTTDSHEGDLLYSICSYEAENEDALSLVEGEKVYVVESTSQDWWFVRKHLTEERGWVPAIYLRDEPSYTLYVQKKLHEKIDKLPIFEKPSPGDEVYAPRFVEKLQPKHAPDGATIQFECQVEGNPRPQITWFRQTAIIKPSPDFQIYYDDDNVATLIIREVFPEDAGTFTCVAKNAAGFASSTTELTVEAPLSDHGSDATGLSRKSLSRESSLADILEGIPPTFSKKPKARVVPEGIDVELECRLVAVPEPELTWLFNGKEVKPSDSLTVSTQSDMHMYCSILSIKHTVKKIHEGTYTVIAKNREGQATMDIILKVKTGEVEPPQVLEPLQDVTISEGESAVLTTQITGNPKPTVTWLKNGKPVPTELKTTVHDDIYTLTLIKPALEDSARYTAVAKNKCGTAETTSHLTVEELPGPQAPLFVERFEEQTIKEKGTIKLLAKVVGNPIPTVTWFRNNKILLASPRNKEFFDGENIILEIIDADSEVDAGDYKCVASNSVGTATHGARITVDVEKVSFTKLLEETVEASETQTVTLECETSHTVSTKWQHNGKELSGMDHRELVQEGRTHRLVIKRVTPLDAGTYTCSVKDQITASTLIVHDIKPDFSRKLEDIEVKELESAILEVEVNSETVDVTWHKDGAQLTPSNEKLFMEKKGNIRKLLIRSISVHDEGEYTCSLGDQECTSEVTVIELPPQIKTKLQDVTVTQGDKATLEVELTKGDAMVRWFKDNKEIQFSEHVQLSIDGKRQKLKIYQAELSDAGVYSCCVGDQTSEARVIVEEPAVEFITKLPEVTLVPVNTDIELTVELSRPDVEVKWLKKGKEIKPSNKYIITSEGAVKKLIIKKATNEDQSEYTCVAINVKTSTKLKVETIEAAPKIMLEKKEYRVKQGEDVNIEVKFTSTPPPKEEWFVNGTVVKKSKRITPTITESSATLTITKVEEKDVGEYTIVLTNNIGEASENVTLIIMEVPGAPGTPDVIDKTDTSVVLHWKKPEFDGNSPITNYILEYHDKEEFLTWHDVKETITETTHTIKDLTTNAQIMFKVSAVNAIGKGPCSDPTVYHKIAKPTEAEAPVIKEPLKDTTAALKESVTLSTVISGQPLPEIKWLRDGKPVKSKTMTYENHVAKYTITDVKESSEGTYTCKASNTAGTAETSCKLVVQEKPRIEIEPGTENQTLRVLGQWKSVVKFFGYPKPEITWKKNKETITSDRHCTIYVDDTTSTIAIYSVERKDTASYIVTAINSAGSTSAELVLRVIDKPTKPQGPILIKDMDKDSVTIEWKPPADCGGLDLVGYSIEKCDMSKMLWTKVSDVDKDITCHTIQRLQEDNEYMFRVFAQNPVGISDALESEVVTVKCKYEKPSPPQGPLEISGMTETSCTIKWHPPLSDGGTPIIDYTVEQKESTKKAWQKVGTTKDLHICISNMKPNTAYEFRITAHNRIGASAPYYAEEPVVAGKRITPPSAPTDFTVKDITSKSVSLKWGPPTSTGGTELTGYVIEKQAALSSKWTKVATLDANVLEYTVENLKEKTEFYFRIYAENSMGLSTPASTGLVSLQTHATVPSPPTAPLETHIIGLNTIIISWGVPETDGGAPLEGYKIAIRDIKKTMWMEVGQVKADIQKLTIKDLQEGHEYLIRIFARNEVGLSDPLESDEPFLVVRPSGMEEDTDVEETAMGKDTPSLSFSTETTTSWMREAGMDADIHSYARGSLLRRSEYFFRIWYYARHLFK